MTTVALFPVPPRGVLVTYMDNVGQGMVGVWVWVLGYLGLGTQISGGAPPDPRYLGWVITLPAFPLFHGIHRKSTKLRHFWRKPDPKGKPIETSTSSIWVPQTQIPRYLGGVPRPQISGGVPPPNPDPNQARCGRVGRSFPARRAYQMRLRWLMLLLFSRGRRTRSVM